MLLLLLMACQGSDTDTDTDTDLQAGSRVVWVPASQGGPERLFRLTWPEEARHASGAPVVVLAPGGWEPGAGRLIEDWERQGWVSLTPVLPGGEEGSHTAEGTYDYRGEASVAVLQDALRYAAGLLPEVSGLTLPEALPLPLSGAPLTVVGQSNGGNLALAALADLEGVEVGALVQAESPVGDQLISVELNGNPYYQPGTCTPTSCPWPGMAEVLALDLEDDTLATGLDEDRVGVWPGRFFLDEDGDGQRSSAEKPFKRMVMGTVDDSILLFPSVELYAALVDSGIRLPPWMATREQVDAFWAVRDGSRHVPAVAAAYPELVVILQGSVEDHLQRPEDHPHLLSHSQGWLDAGHTRVRLNADAAYLAHTSGLDPALLPDCPMGEPLTWPGIEACLVPETLEGVSLDEPSIQAAILEAVDRVEHGEYAVDLDGVL